MNDNYWKTIPSIYEQLTPKQWMQYGHQIWCIIMMLIAGLDLVAKYPFHSSRTLISSLFLSTIGILLPLATMWGRKAALETDSRLSTFIDLPKEIVKRHLFHQLHEAITGNWIKWTSGIFVIFAGVATIVFMSNAHQNSNSLLFLVILRIPLFFFCGTAAYSFARGLMMPAYLAKLPIRVPLYQDSYTGITSLNSAIFSISLVGLIFYALLVGAIITGPFSLEIIMGIWLSIIGLSVILIFPYAIWNLHLAMKKAKRDALIALSSHLEKVLQKNIRKPTKTSLDLAKSLFEFQGELKKLPEWPIDFRALFTALTAVLLPILTILLNLLK